MITLYYVNKNQALGTIEIESFEACQPLPEGLIFVAFRDGLNFIKEPPQIYTFTDLERLIMGSEFFDMRYLKDSDFRKENSSSITFCVFYLSFFEMWSTFIIHIILLYMIDRIKMAMIRPIGKKILIGSFFI